MWFIKDDKPVKENDQCHHPCELRIHQERKNVYAAYLDGGAWQALRYLWSLSHAELQICMLTETQNEASFRPPAQFPRKEVSALLHFSLWSSSTFQAQRMIPICISTQHAELQHAELIYSPECLTLRTFRNSDQNFCTDVEAMMGGAVLLKICRLQRGTSGRDSRCTVEQVARLTLTNNVPQ
jgi:hypothetical protein